MVQRVKFFFLVVLPLLMHGQALYPEESPSPPPLNLPTDTPSEQLTQSYQAAFLKMILSMIGLILLVFVSIWLLRRLGQGKFRGFGSHKSISILEKKPLSPKSMLYLIEIEGQKILIAESQLEVRRLSEIKPSPEPSEEEIT